MLLSWWAFAIHRFWPLWSGRHVLADCCNSKIWVLFSALLFFCWVHHALYNSLSQVLSNRGFSLVQILFRVYRFFFVVVVSFPPHPNVQSLSDVRCLHVKDWKEYCRCTYSQTLRLSIKGLFQNLSVVVRIPDDRSWSTELLSLSVFETHCHSWNVRCLIVPCSWDSFNQNLGQIAAF